MCILGGVRAGKEADGRPRSVISGVAAAVNTWSFTRLHSPPSARRLALEKKRPRVHCRLECSPLDCTFLLCIDRCVLRRGGGGGVLNAILLLCFFVSVWRWIFFCTFFSPSFPPDGKRLVIPFRSLNGARKCSQVQDRFDALLVGSVAGCSRVNFITIQRVAIRWFTYF